MDPHRLAERLTDAHRPAEETFLQVGERLAEAAGGLPKLQSAFGALLKELTENDAVLSVAEIKGVFGEALSERPAARTDELSQLADLAAGLDRRIAALQKIVAEVGTLSVNARIQAAQIGGDTDDVTVFTLEMARLSMLARAQLTQIGDRLTDLRGAIDTAQTVAVSFMREGAAELFLIREKIEHGGAILGDHQRRIALKVEGLSRQSSEIGERINTVIASLQINDITSQRIDHIRSAVAYATEALGARDAAPTAPLGAVYRLQAVQLDRTVADFDASIGTLVESLQGLANAADGLGREVRTAVATESGGTSFIVELGEHLRRAKALLLEYDMTRQRTHEIIASVSDGFGEMVREIKAIDAIEADLRLVALNATLKCARLGPAGRTLAVVAQELRTESRRAESGARELSASIAEAIGLTSILDDESSRREADAISGLLARTTRTIDGITAFAEQVAGTVGQIGERSRRVAELLRETASSVELGGNVVPMLREIADELQRHAAHADPDATGGADLPDDVLAALARSYTMESERDIHTEVLGTSVSDFVQPGRDACQENPADIDDVLFG